MILKRQGQQFWSKEADQALISLVGVYGAKNWGWIAGKLKEIYSIELTRGAIQVQSRWRIINPEIYQQKLSHEQLKEVYAFAMENKSNWSQIAKNLKSIRLSMEKVIKQFRSICFKSLRVWNTLMCPLIEINDRNRKKIAQIRWGTIAKLLELTKDEIESKFRHDELYCGVLTSAKRFFEIIKIILDNSKGKDPESKKGMEDVLRQTTTEAESQQIFDHVFFANMINVISQQRMTFDKEGNFRIIMQPENRKSSQPVPVKFNPKSWAQAIEIKEKNQQDQNRETLLKQYKFQEEELIFTKAEIQHIKESNIYKRLAFEEIVNRINQEMYALYGDTVSDFIADRKKYQIIGRELADEIKVSKKEEEDEEDQDDLVKKNLKRQIMIQDEDEKRTKQMKNSKQFQTKIEDCFILVQKKRKPNKPYKPVNHSYDEKNIYHYPIKTHTWRDMEYREDVDDNFDVNLEEAAAVSSILNNLSSKTQEIKELQKTEI